MSGELVPAGDAGAPAGGAEATIAEVEGIMRSDHGRYIGDTAMQQRYLAALEARDGTSETGEESGPLVPMISAHEFEASGGDPSNYLDYMRLTGDVSDIVQSVPAAERGDFLADFEALSQPSQRAVLLELRATPPGPGWAGEEAVARFASTPQGAAAVRAWGQNAPRNVAKVAARYERILARLGDADFEALSGWLNGLTPGGFSAVLRFLSR